MIKLFQAVEWHIDELPPSDPYKKYLVIIAPWDYNKQQNINPRLAIADYYTGEEPTHIYKDKPWHFSLVSSRMEKEVLAWADVGEVDDILDYLFSETKA